MWTRIAVQAREPAKGCAHTGLPSYRDIKGITALGWFEHATCQAP